MSKLYELSPNIWVHEVALGDYEVRAILILGGQHVLVWDTLSHPRDMQPFLPLIEDRELSIVYSHADWDHVWGTAGLPYHRASIIGHDHSLDRFDTDVPVELDKKKQREPNCWDAVELVSPTRTFKSEFAVDCGLSPLVLHHLPGHTPDSIVAFLPDRGILLMGDTVETPFPFLSESCPLHLWIRELQKWEKEPRVETVIPSHGALGGKEILRRNIRYLQNLEAGQPYTLPSGLTDFYIETHKANMRACALK